MKKFVLGLGIIGTVLAILLGVFAYRGIVSFFAPEPDPIVITKTNEHTTTLTVDRPVLTEKIITKQFADPRDAAAIKSLLAENAALRLEVTSMSNTVAALQSKGEGAMTKLETPGAPPQYQFKDWRLDFRTDLVQGLYELNQTFVIMTTTGKDKQGQRTTLVNVFEVGPNGERRPVTATTTVLTANEQTPRWYRHPNLHGGFGIAADPNDVKTTGGVVGLQWLKRGSTEAPGDTPWAVATPVMFFSQGIKEAGVLPVSFNLGTLPYSPFSNLWVSPYIGFDFAGRRLSRVGIVLTSTF